MSPPRPSTHILRPTSKTCPGDMFWNFGTPWLRNSKRKFLFGFGYKIGSIEIHRIHPSCRDFFLFLSILDFILDYSLIWCFSGVQLWFRLAKPSSANERWQASTPQHGVGGLVVSWAPVDLIVIVNTGRVCLRMALTPRLILYNIIYI